MKTKPTRSEEPTSKRKLFLPLFLGGLMVLSTFAIIFSGPSQPSTLDYTYHDIYFQSTPQGWQSTVQGLPLVLQHGPQALESLYSDLSFTPATSLLGLEKLYVSSLPPEPAQEAMRDLYLNSNTLPPISFSCIADIVGCEELPIKTCKDASASIGVVIFRLGETEEFTTEGTCVTLTANTTLALTQMTDKLIYTLYGVY